ncbi:MAG TPA: hypothetical protein DEB39_15100 [Planctomycetaceae bacterium]|nr:hypothetical protein [Planctomycetaceae bacterium]
MRSLLKSLYGRLGFRTVRRLISCFRILVGWTCVPRAKQVYSGSLSRVVNGVVVNGVATGETPRHRSGNPPPCVLTLNTTVGRGGAAAVMETVRRGAFAHGWNTPLMVGHADRTVLETAENARLLPVSPSNRFDRARLRCAETVLGWQDYFRMGPFRLPEEEPFQKADLLHLHNLHGGWFSPFALPLLSARKPTIWTLHDMHALTGHCAHSRDCERWREGCGRCPRLESAPPVFYDATDFVHADKKRLYEACRLTVAVPSRWLMQIAREGILGSQDIRLIYNGVDPRLFRPRDKRELRRELGVPEGATVLLFSAAGGKSNMWKGGMRYFSPLRKRLENEPGLFFISLGGGRECRSCRERSLPYVHSRETMAKYYALSDLFVYPSLADNCPLGVLESMACGTPVVSFRTGGIPELVEHGKTGYLAEYGSLDDLHNGVMRLLRRDNDRDGMGTAARRTVLERFTEEKMIAAYLRLYEELLSSRDRNNKSPERSVAQ